MRYQKNIAPIFLIPAVMALAGGAAAQEPAFDEVEIGITKITDTLYMMTGEGGNLGVSVGEDGTFLIDDQFAPLSDKILVAIKDAGGDVPKFVINTHWHGDHTGGNENFGAQGSIIIAHHNVRERLSVDNYLAAFDMTSPAYPAVALPVVTFSEEVTVHLNGDAIEVRHVPGAHTDGDSIIYFKNSNVLHTGDIVFNGFFPFIDTAHGGSLKGMIAAADSMLEMINADTQIIPGHGPMASRDDLQTYRNTLATAYDRLSTLKAAGKSLEEAVAEAPLADLEEEWGDGIFTSARWIEVIYDGLE